MNSTWLIDIATLVGAIIAALLALFNKTLSRNKALVSFNIALLVLIAGLLAAIRYKNITSIEHHIEAIDARLPQIEESLTQVKYATAEGGPLAREIVNANELIAERNRGVDYYFDGPRGRLE